MMHYTGIGSRQTPEPVFKQMVDIAKHLNAMGYRLRSGGADGADTAFEIGAGVNKDIFLPWRGFNNNLSTLYEISSEALDLASTIHPIFDHLKPAVQRLHARNTYQVLGGNLNSPSAFLVCYTPCGSEHENTISNKTGGTGTAIKLASRKNIPIFNLHNTDAVQRLCGHLNTLLLTRPRVLNKYKNVKNEPGVYIGRGTPYGNPFPITKEVSRDMVCDQFEQQVLPTLDVEPLRGFNLICYCNPARCHGDSIFEKLYGRRSLTRPLGFARKRANGYEVSSVGDKRFSALYAVLNDGRTIEQAYQLDCKGFREVTNNWKDAKGRPPRNGMDFNQLYIEYKKLWKLYMDENPLLFTELRYLTAGKYLTDCFSTTDINQARALYELLVC